MLEVPKVGLLDTCHKLALTSPYGKFRVGAIIARKKKIISMGINQKKSHPLQARFSSRPHLEAWLHAEIHAITLAQPKELEGANIYIVRALKNDECATSKPCAGCMSALREYGFKNMFYCHNGKFYCEEVV